MGTTPLRNDTRAQTGADAAGYERECVLLAGALPFILARMRPRPGSGGPRPPATAASCTSSEARAGEPVQQLQTLTKCYCSAPGA